MTEAQLIKYCTPEFKDARHKSRKVQIKFPMVLPRPYRKKGAYRWCT